MRPRSGIAVLSAAIPLVSLALDPKGWFPFGPCKWLVVSAVFPLGTALSCWGQRVRVRRRVAFAVLAFLGWLSIAAAVGYERWYAWIGTPERRMGVATWVVCALALLGGHCFDERARREALSWALIVAALGLGGAATAEAFGYEPSVFAITSGRLTATMGSAAYLGALSALLVPAVVAIAADRTQRRLVRRAAALAAGLVSIACLGSGARAAWFGLVVAAVLCAVIRRDDLRAAGRRAIAGGALLAVALVAIALWSPVGGRVASASDPDSPGGRSRVDEWRVAVHVVARHPLTGVGPEGYRIAFAEGVDDHYEQSYGRSPLPDRAHSGPLDVALAGGLPLLGLWSVVVALMIAAALAAIRSSDVSLVGLGAAVVAYFCGQLLLFPTAELEPIAWLLGGVLLAAASSRSTGGTVPRAVTRPLSALVAVIAFVAVLAGARDLAADRRAREAADALATGSPHTAAGKARDAIDLRPDEVRLHLLLAQGQEADQQGTAAALASVADALRISPRDPASLRLRAELLIDRATATHLPADAATARQATKQLVAADPHNSELWTLDGQAARAVGDEAGAQASFAEANRLSPRGAPLGGR